MTFHLRKSYLVTTIFRELQMAQRGADLEFDVNLQNYFGCKRGAYSPVTPTEAGDGQITLTGSEKKIAIDFFGAEELAPYRGNDGGSYLGRKRAWAGKHFHLFPALILLR